VNCLNSFQVSFQAVFTCQNAYVRRQNTSGHQSKLATSHKAFIVGITFSLSIPTAISCFAVSLIPVSSKGVCFANSDKSSKNSFDFSALQSKVSKLILACSNLSPSVTACFVIAHIQVATAPHTNIPLEIPRNHPAVSVIFEKPSLALSAHLARFPVNVQIAVFVPQSFFAKLSNNAHNLETLFSH
jgi:hypothetical protein